jgi:hypothetical protein
MKLVKLVYDDALVDHFGLNRPIVFNDHLRFLVSVIINLSTLSLYYINTSDPFICLPLIQFSV